MESVSRRAFASLLVMEVVIFLDCEYLCMGSLMPELLQCSPLDTSACALILIHGRKLETESGICKENFIK